MKNRVTKAFIVMLAMASGIDRASAQHFKQVTGTLTQVAAGRNEVFGIGTANQIYRYKAGTKAFVQIPGSLAQVAVGGGTLSQKDEIWGVGTSGEVYHFNYGTKIFTQVAGTLTQVAVGEGYGDGAVDKCHTYEVWGLSSTQLIYRYNYCTKGFDQVAGSLTHIATGGGEVWGLNSSAQIFYFQPGQGFLQVRGSLQQIAVGAHEVLGLDGEGYLYRWDFTSKAFLDFYGAGFAQVATGGDGLWLINTASLSSFHFDQVTGLVYYPLGAIVQIAVGSGTGVWAIDSSNRVYVFVRP